METTKMEWTEDDQPNKVALKSSAKKVPKSKPSAIFGFDEDDDKQEEEEQAVHKLIEPPVFPSCKDLNQRSSKERQKQPPNASWPSPLTCSSDSGNSLILVYLLCYVIQLEKKGS
jgi:hypothetical protein